MKEEQSPLSASKKMGEQQNPLVGLWKLLSVIGGIISLSSLAEKCFEDVLKWKAFIALIINTYRSITEPLMDFLFGWISLFTVPYWVGDYLILGSILTTSLAKTARFTAANESRIFTVLTSIAFWPAIVIGSIGWAIECYIYVRNLVSRRSLIKNPEFLYSRGSETIKIENVDLDDEALRERVFEYARSKDCMVRKYRDGDLTVELEKFDFPIHIMAKLVIIYDVIVFWSWFGVIVLCMVILLAINSYY